MRAHPAAVVSHRDQGRATPRNLHRDRARAGIQRVFDQLLDRGGRTLDHLSGRNLAGDLLGQDMNDAVRHRGGQREVREEE